MTAEIVNEISVCCAASRWKPTEDVAVTIQPSRKPVTVEMPAVRLGPMREKTRRRMRFFMVGR
jgi:hypothetical protein